MKKWCKLFLVLFALLTSVSSYASSIYLAKNASTGVGQVGLDLFVQLDAAGSPYVSSFDVDLGFDTALLAFDSVEFGRLLGDVTQSEAWFQSQEFQSGVLNVAELSLLFADVNQDVFGFGGPYLADLQQNLSLFKLATINFNVLQAGYADFALTLNVLVDGNATIFSVPLQNVNGLNQVAVAPVPLPGAIGLFMLGLVSLRLRVKK